MDEIKQIATGLEPDLLEYYEENSCCFDIKVEPLFVDIKTMIDPIKKLSEHFGSFSDYHTNLYEKHHSKISKIELLEITDFDYELDEIALQYVKCKPDLVLYVCSEYVPDAIFMNTVIKKSVTISSKQALSLVYQLNMYRRSFDSPTKLSDERNKIFGDQKFINLKIVVASRSHTSLLINNQVHYQSLNFVELIEFSELFFNKNSFRLMQYQRIDRILYGKFAKSKILLMTFKKWLYTNILLIDQMRFMTASGTILYSLGMRNISDMDVTLINIGEKISNNFDELIKKYFIDIGKFPYIDIKMKCGETLWIDNGIESEYLDEWWDKEWPALYGAKSMIDTVFNPKFHYYYLGLKLQCMEADIQRRIKRSRPAAYADLIALIKLGNQIINIPKLDKGFWKNHVYYDFTDKEIGTLVKTIQWHLRKKYNISIDIPEIKKLTNIDIIRN